MSIRSNLTFKPITEKDYWEALECLPPAVMTGNGFLLGEPYDHVRVVTDRVHELPRYHAFVEIGGRTGGRHFQSNEPMTVIEFRALTPADVIGGNA